MVNLIPSVSTMIEFALIVALCFSFYYAIKKIRLNDSVAYERRKIAEAERLVKV